MRYSFLLAKEPHILTRILWCALLLTLYSSQSLPQNKTVKEQTTFKGQKRVYYLFVPETLDPAKPAPLLITLHSANSSGKSVIVEWKLMAIQKGIVLLAPNALNNWFPPVDWPDFLHSLVESIKARFNIDGRRVYLFGFSAGGIHSAMTAILEPEYFAAVAAIGGYLPGKKRYPLSDNRIPIAFWLGDRDPFISVEALRETANYLRGMGFPVRITVIEGVGHTYPDISGQVNEAIWSFLGSKALTHDPHWIDVNNENLIQDTPLGKRSRK